VKSDQHSRHPGEELHRSQQALAERQRHQNAQPQSYRPWRVHRQQPETEAHQQR
jgi:hypothetical protein